MLTIFGLFFLVFIGAIVVFSSIKVIYEYERGVVFTLGKYSGTRNPGINLIFPVIQELRKIDMRITTEDIPKQEAITKDNISTLVHAVVYYKVVRPADAVLKITDYHFAVAQYTQAALRDVIGNHEIDFVLAEREKVADDIHKIVHAETKEWGINIDSIKIQEIELPAEMKRAMAKQAEAERVRRATIITSRGELAASENLMKAAQNLSKSDSSLLLRTLQTVREIAADPSEKIVILLPMQWQKLLGKIVGK